MARIVIIDSNIMFREGLMNLLREEPGITIVGEASTIFEALNAFLDKEPSLFLVDADLPDLQAFHGIRLLRGKYPQAQVVLLCARHTDDQLIGAVRNGARGYLLKQISLNKLVSSIRALDRGEAVIPRAYVGRLLDELYTASQPEVDETMHLLTRREIDVLRELGNGRSNRQIAEQLEIAENTVKVHVHNILEKLCLRNRRQAARFARCQWKNATHIQSPLDTIQSAHMLQYIN